MIRDRLPSQDQDMAPPKLCGSCAVPPILEWLVTIPQIVILFPTAAGCSGTFAHLIQSNRLEQVPQRQKAMLYCSNFREVDLICGIEEKLSAQIDSIVSHHQPHAIYVASSCGSGVTGDEIAPILEKLQPRFAIPLLTLVCEIYGQKRWGNGFNPRRYPLLTRLTSPRQSKTQLINVIDTSANRPLLPLLAQLGLALNVIARGSNHAALAQMGEASATLQLSYDRFSSFLAKELEQTCNIPRLTLPLPYGYVSTTAFLRELHQLQDPQNGEHGIIAKQQQHYCRQLASIKKALAQVSVALICSDPERVVLPQLLRELGLNVIPLFPASTMAGLKITVTHDGIMLPATASSPSRQRPAPGRKCPPTLLELQETLCARIRSGENIDLVICKHAGFRPDRVMAGIPAIWLPEQESLAGYQQQLALGQRISHILQLKKQQEIRHE